MRLYTITTEKAYTVLNDRGWLTGNAHHAWRDFLPSYKWMGDQMTKRVGPPPGRSRYPIWGRIEKPDLRSGGHLPRGNRGYRLEIEVPDQEVLLSDFQQWHIVLMDRYISNSEEDDDRFEAREQKLGDKADQLLRPEIEASWERIFEIDGELDPEWWGTTLRLQATFWRLELTQVIRATPFISRWRARDRSRMAETR